MVRFGSALFTFKGKSSLEKVQWLPPSCNLTTTTININLKKPPHQLYFKPSIVFLPLLCNNINHNSSIIIKYQPYVQHIYELHQYYQLYVWFEVQVQLNYSLNFNSALTRALNNLVLFISEAFAAAYAVVYFVLLESIIEPVASIVVQFIMCISNFIQLKSSNAGHYDQNAIDQESPPNNSGNQSSNSNQLSNQSSRSNSIDRSGQ
ncbi:hypothetical protein ACTFIV_008870 [Dictyostelium citrinum]